MKCKSMHCGASAHLNQWFIVEEGGGIGVNVAGSIDQALGRDVSFVVYGWARGAIQKLVG